MKTITVNHPTGSYPIYLGEDVLSQTGRLLAEFEAEVVEDGVSGGLTPDGDIYAMARTCLDLLANPDRLRTMTQAARQRASLFGKEEIVDRYVSFYHETLARRP